MRRIDGECTDKTSDKLILNASANFLAHQDRDQHQDRNHRVTEQSYSRYCQSSVTVAELSSSYEKTQLLPRIQITLNWKELSRKTFRRATY